MIGRTTFDTRSMTMFADVRLWHKADNPTAPAFVRYWSGSGHA
jgi:hypothetical protein